jgi:hypothetical protein
VFQRSNHDNVGVHVVTGCPVRTGRIEKKDLAGGKLPEPAAVIVVEILPQQPVQRFGETGQ